MPRQGDPLSPRETEVLDLIAEGFSNPEVAARLHVEESTVKHHLANIMRKLGVKNRTAAAAVLWRRRLGIW